MPITSHQVGGMIGGQLGMFGNFASYANQISPGQAGNRSMPSYSNPMGQGAGMAFEAPPPPGFEDHRSGAVRGMGSAASHVAGAYGAATLAGSFLPGRIGGAFSALDPFSSGLGGALRGSGLASGVTSEMGIMARLGSYGGNAARIAGGGFGGMARAGVMGLGAGMLAAAPAMAIGGALQYGAGQMMEGAQFQHQVGNVLKQNFRHVNSSAQNGVGFSDRESNQIGGMIRNMGNSDMMSTPQELLRVMQSGAASGSFSAVRDVKEFKKKFQDMVSSLKEVAKVMSTTLEGAMPFISESKKMGLWTPQDIKQGVGMARGASINSGLSMAETTGMMSQGSDMARSIGASGASGAAGMAKSLSMVGGGLRSGILSERQLSEATGGLKGSEAVSSLAGTLQHGTTRFAASGRARWMLAAMANKGMDGLDEGKMGLMTSGAFSLGDIRGMAEKNVSGRGADFVSGEQDMRSDLVKQGPMAQLGLVRTLAGKRLYGKSGTDKLVTRRMMEQYFGVGGKQADAMADMARRLPEIMRENQQRTNTSLDQESRNRDEMMNHSMEGISRKIGAWWSKSVQEPLQKMGASVSASLSSYMEEAGNKMWGRPSSGFALRGLSNSESHAFGRAVGGDNGGMKAAFGTSEDNRALLGGLTHESGATGLGRQLMTTRSAIPGLNVAGAAIMGIGKGWDALTPTGKAGDMRSDAQKQKSSILDELGGGGSMNSDAASALGYSDTKHADTAVAGAQEGLESGKYKEFVMNLRASGMKESEIRNQVRISAGKGTFGKGLANLVSGKSGEQADAILMHSQSASLREGAAGLTRDKSEGGGVNLNDTAKDLQTRAAQISDKLGDEVDGVHGGELMKLFSDPATKSRYEDILRSVDPKNPGATKEALEKFAADIPDKDQRDSVRALAKGSGSPAVMGMLGQMGQVVKSRARLAAKEVAGQHNERMIREMGDNKDTIMKIFDAAKVGGESANMGAKLKKIMETTDVESRTALLNDFMTSAQGIDKKDLAGMMASLGNVGGTGDVIKEALGGAAKVQGVRETFAGKDTGAQAVTLNQLLGGSNRMDSKDVAALKSGKGAASVIEKQLEGISDPGEKEERRKMLMGLSGGAEGMKNFEKGVQRIIGRDVGGQDHAVQRFSDLSKKKDSIQGAMGSGEGMHSSLIRMTSILEQIRDKKEGEVVENLQSTPP